MDSLLGHLRNRGLSHAVDPSGSALPGARYSACSARLVVGRGPAWGYRPGGIAVQDGTSLRAPQGHLPEPARCYAYGADGTPQVVSLHVPNAI
jgi:hypothetical protein